MKVKLNDVSGDIVKDNDTYILTDNNYLNNLTYSRTFLKPGQKTNGHSHDNEEEVYIFTEGQALMQIDTEYHHASKGDVFLIKAGEFHRVFNKDIDFPCAFTCIFQKYDREGDAAIYNEQDEQPQAD